MGQLFPLKYCNLFVDTCIQVVYILYVIKGFGNKGLAELFEKGSSRYVGNRYKAKAIRFLDLLENAESLTDLQVPGFDFHRLRGNPTRYAMKVSANYRITFGWQKGAIDVNLEDYH